MKQFVPIFALSWSIYISIKKDAYTDIEFDFRHFGQDPNINFDMYIVNQGDQQFKIKEYGIMKKKRFWFPQKIKLLFYKPVNRAGGPPVRAIGNFKYDEDYDLKQSVDFHQFIQFFGANQVVYPYENVRFETTLSGIEVDDFFANNCIDPTKDKLVAYLITDKNVVIESNKFINCPLILWSKKYEEYHKKNCQK